MPEQLKSSEVNSKTDPSVAKQYDNETNKVKQIQDFFSLVDDKKIGILNTYRNSVGTYHLSHNRKNVHSICQDVIEPTSPQ